MNIDTMAFVMETFHACSPHVLVIFRYVCRKKCMSSNNFCLCPTTMLTMGEIQGGHREGHLFG